MSDQRGISLLETLITITLTSIIICLSYPQITTFVNRQQLDYEATRLVSELRYLQELTRTINREHSSFTAVPSEPVPELYLQTNGYLIKRNNKLLRDHQYPSGIVSRHNRTSLHFTPGGDMATPLTIRLQNGSQYREVIIDSVGRVRIKPQ